jgi:hypothetical protein
VAGVYTPSWVLDSSGNLSPSAKVNGVPDYSFVSGRDEFAHFIINCCLSWQTLVFRRELYLQHGPLKHADIAASDWDYLIEISKGRHFAFINEPSVGVRIHDKSHSATVQRNEGIMVKDMLFLWRKWLLEQDDLPVLTATSWNSMANMLVGGVQLCWGPDEAKAREYLAEFEALKQAYYARMDRAFHGGLTRWLPSRVDVDDAGVPLFRTGLVPLDIDSTKRVLFFHQINPPNPHWRHVLDTYVQAFSTTDNVELVLWLDPALDFPVETISEACDASVAKAGIPPDTAPDILLLTDPLTREQLAQLYTAMHVIVPAGDTQQFDRGARVGRLVMTHTTQDAWRRAAEKFLGPLVPAETASRQPAT